MREKATPDTKDKLAAVVDRFFDRVTEDPLIGLYFEDTDLAAHKERFTAFLALMMADEEDTYQGKDVYNAHKGRDIMDEAHENFSRMLVEMLNGAGFAPADVERVEKKLSALKERVVGRFVPSGAYIFKPQKFN